MIAPNKDFREGYPEKGYKELIKAVLDDPFAEGTSFGGLNPDYITEMIKYIIYTEKYKKVNVTVAREPDGYHLKIKINKKGK